MATALRLVVGLGNPGRDYAATRHNAGAWLVERLADAERIAMQSSTRFQARVGGTETRLAIPETYMNESGRPVAALARFYRIAPAEVLVAHDELDLKPGVVKLKHGGGFAGHNGLKDIAAWLGSGGFWRLRIGIGHPRDGTLSEQEVADYVLRPPPASERARIDDAIARATAIWPHVVSGDLARAMHALHTKPVAADGAAT